MNISFKATAQLTEGMSVKCTARGHSIILDEVKSFGGDDTGMNPIEATLSALGACQLIVAKLYAESHDIDLKGLSVELEGKLPADSFKDPNKKPHIEEIKTKFYIKTGAPEQKVMEFMSFVEDNCPVADVLKNPAQMIPEVIIEPAS